MAVGGASRPPWPITCRVSGWNWLGIESQLALDTQPLTFDNPCSRQRRNTGARYRMGSDRWRQDVRAFEELLAEAVGFHGQICPGQVLGVRMAMLGCRLLGLDLPVTGKRLVVYIEIDRCAADAIQTVTGCRLGKRTLKLLDYGKLAATFLDLQTAEAYRVAAREESRELARVYAPGASGSHAAQVQAYQVMPDQELFSVQRVQIKLPELDRPGPPARRVRCEACGEGVNDGREIVLGGRILCRPCASGACYLPIADQPALLGAGHHSR